MISVIGTFAAATTVNGHHCCAGAINTQKPHILTGGASFWRGSQAARSGEANMALRSLRWLYSSPGRQHSNASTRALVAVPVALKDRTGRSRS